MDVWSVLWLYNGTVGGELSFDSDITGTTDDGIYWFEGTVVDVYVNDDASFGAVLPVVWVGTVDRYIPVLLPPNIGVPVDVVLSFGGERVLWGGLRFDGSSERR